MAADMKRTATHGKPQRRLAIVRLLAKARSFPITLPVSFAACPYGIKSNPSPAPKNLR